MDVGARAYHDVAQTIAQECYQVLALNSTRWDTDNIHDDVTDNSRLTCKTAGKYLIAAQAHFELGGNCMFVIAIRLNGVGLGGAGVASWPTAEWGPPLAFKSWDRNHDGPTRMSCMTIWDLEVGDYVELVVLNGTWSEPGTVDILAEAYTTPEFMMQRIGPPGIETFSQALTGLKPNTTYHFRAKATNAAGTSYGADRTFTTLPALAVTTNPATAVGQTTATLNGTLDADGEEACEVRFQYGETTDYGKTTIWQTGKTTGDTFSQEVRGLLPGRVYHFRAVVTNSAETSYGADRTFHTEALSAEAHQALGRHYSMGRHGL